LNATARQELFQRVLPEGNPGHEGRGDGQAGTGVLGRLLEPLPEKGGVGKRKAYIGL